MSLFNIHFQEDQEKREYESQCAYNDSIVSSTDVFNLGFEQGLKDETPNSYHWKQTAFRAGYLEGRNQFFNRMFNIQDNCF
jgi:hypothetical protein